MNDKDASKTMIDATEVALVATGAIVGGQGGAALGVLSVLANKMIRPLEHFRRAREGRFLQRVFHFLEANDPDGAAKFVAEHADSEQFSDALDRGYERMRRTFDPFAEECVCVLVADYIGSGSVTDRRFVRTGGLLEVSDKATLATMTLVCEAHLIAIKVNGPGTLGIVFHSGGVPAKKSPFFFVAMYQGPKVIGISEDFEAPTNLERVLAQMGSHDFGETLRGFGHAAPENRGEGAPSSSHQFRPTDQIGMSSLHRYLAPLRKTTA